MNTRVISGTGCKYLVAISTKALLPACPGGFPAAGSSALRGLGDVHFDVKQFADRFLQPDFGRQSVLPCHGKQEHIKLTGDVVNLNRFIPLS